MQRVDLFGMRHVSWVVGGIMVGSQKKALKLQIAQWGSGLKPSRRGPRTTSLILSLPSVGCTLASPTPSLLVPNATPLGALYHASQKHGAVAKCAHLPYPSAEFIAKCLVEKHPTSCVQTGK